MKKSIISLTGSMFLIFLFMSNTATGQNQLVGSWDFTVSQAPWEYSRGKFIIEEDSEKGLTTSVVFSSGSKMTMSKVTQENEKVTFEATVEGYPIKTIVTLKDGNLVGHVETYDGNMAFIAKRSSQE